MSMLQYGVNEDLQLDADVCITAWRNEDLQVGADVCVTVWG